MMEIELSAQDRARLDAILEILTQSTQWDIIVSCSEAARLLHKTRATISCMIRDKRLDKVTIDGSTGIRLSDIRKITNSQ